MAQGRPEGRKMVLQRTLCAQTCLESSEDISVEITGVATATKLRESKLFDKVTEESFIYIVM